MIKIILIIVIVFLVLSGAFLVQKNLVSSPTDDLNNIVDILPGKKTLNLINQRLEKIPSYVFNQTSLEELNVSNNLLTGSIQGEIRHLSNLKILNASNNQMTGVPAEVGQLQKLEVLDLSNNKLTGLPNEIGNLKNLKVLNLSGNQYSQQDLDYIKSKLPSTVNIIL